MTDPICPTVATVSILVRRHEELLRAEKRAKYLHSLLERSFSAQPGFFCSGACGHCEECRVNYEVSEYLKVRQ